MLSRLFGASWNPFRICSASLDVRKTKIPGKPNGRSQNGTGETRESKRNGNPPELLDMRVVYVRVVLLRVRLLGFFERETGSVFRGPPHRCCVPVWCPFKTHQTKGGLPQQKTHTR